MIARRVPLRDLSSELARQLYEYSIYASPAFVSLFETIGGRAVYFVAEETGIVVAAVPVIEFGSGVLARMQALPDGLFAPIWVSDEEQSRAGSIRSELVRQVMSMKYLRRYLTDYDNAFDMNDCEMTVQTTSVIDLAVSAELGGWAPPDKTLRAEIAKSEREGVKVSVFEPAGQMQAFLKLMEQTESRHGRFPKYRPAFWDALGLLAEKERRIRWFCVEHEHELAASHIYFLDRGIAFNWQVFYDKKHSALKANQAITYRAANEFGCEGITALNLGISPPDAEGLKSYKEKWGGREYQYRIFKKTSWLGKFV